MSEPGGFLAGVQTSADPGVRVVHDPVDVTGGQLGLSAVSDEVLCLTVLGLTMPPHEIAARLGLVPVGGFLHGAVWGQLHAHGEPWRVTVDVAPAPDAPDGLLYIGHVTDRHARRWSAALDGRTYRVVVFVEATHGLTEVDVRILRAALEGLEPVEQGPAPVDDDRPVVVLGPTREQLDATPAPLPPAGWYPDPADTAMQRWWDGVGWTHDLASS